MKTKSHASKARVSKIPPKSHSILALAISKLAKLNPTAEPEPEPEPPNPQNPNTTHDDVDTDLHVPDTPQSPMQPDENPEKALTCSGKDCSFSIDECADLEDCFVDDGKFYCPSCLYKSAIDEFRLAENEFKLAKERALEARRGLFQFVGGGTVQNRPVESVEVRGGECVSGNPGQGISTVIPESPMVADEGRECEGNGLDEVVMDQVDNVDGETGNRSRNGNGNSGAEKDWNKDYSIPGICKERDKSMVAQRCTSVSRESGDGNGNNVEDENGNRNSRVVGGKNAVSSSGICGKEQYVSSRNEGVVDQKGTSVSRGSGDGDGNLNSSVDIEGKNAASSSGACDREQYVSSRNEGMVDQQCTSVSRESGDGNGNNVDDENEDQDSRLDVGGKNAASSSRVCNREQYVSTQNKGMVDQQCTSVSRESGDGNGNNAEDETGNRNSRVNIRGKNDALLSGVCNRERRVSSRNKGIVDQQCTSVSRESGDGHGNNVDDENENRNSRVDIRGKNAASSSRVCNKEKHGSRQIKDIVDQQSSSVSEESSGEEGLDLLDDDSDWRQPRKKTKDAVKKFQNGGHKAHLRHLKGKIGIESRNSQNVSTDVGDPFSVYQYQDESVGRVGNTNPPELRKRPRETASDSSEVNISERSPKRPLNSIMPESKRARWTSEEEKILMEAVERFSLNCRKNMSWASVMEYGRDVFHASRTADNLRDKWRVMVKGRRAGRK